MSSRVQSCSPDEDSPALPSSGTLFLDLGDPLLLLGILVAKPWALARGDCDTRGELQRFLNWRGVDFGISGRDCERGEQCCSCGARGNCGDLL